jgi:hypothetical protein
MPKRLAHLGISSPGSLGLNKQIGTETLDPQWATEATNCVIDDLGRLSSRKGSRRINASAIGASDVWASGVWATGVWATGVWAEGTGTKDVEQIFEYVDGDGNNAILVAANNKIYRTNGSTLDDITGSITTPTANNWKFQNLNGKCVALQQNHVPIVMTTTGGSFADIVMTGTEQPTTNSVDILAAFGFLWVLDGTDLKYSNLLDETTWSSKFDLSLVWQGGMDEGIGLGEHNGHLVIFGKSSIVIYENPYDPASTMQIVENIKGIGCVARDSIQSTGTDIIFLSDSGLRTLGRTIQEKSMPVTDLSKNVRDYLLAFVGAETNTKIKSAYYETEGFYAISFPTSIKVFYFDIRNILPDGSARAGEWDIKYTALHADRSQLLYVGRSGYISKYFEFLDDVDSDGTGGTSYNFKYHSTWNSLGNQQQDLSSFIKILKKASIQVIGSVNQTLTLKWAFDYNDTFSSTNLTLTSPTVSRWGIAQYGIDRWSGNVLFANLKAPISKSGRIVKIGIEGTVNQEQVSIQRVDLQAKIGRTTL